jgi:hypothetical protein
MKFYLNHVNKSLPLVTILSQTNPVRALMYRWFNIHLIFSSYWLLDLLNGALYLVLPTKLLCISVLHASHIPHLPFWPWFDHWYYLVVHKYWRLQAGRSDLWFPTGFFTNPLPKKIIQPGSGVYLAFSSVGTVDGGRGIRWLGREVNRYLHLVLKLRIEWSCASPILIYLHGMGGEMTTTSPLHFSSCSYLLSPFVFLIDTCTFLCSLFLEHPDPIFFPLCERPSLTPM